MWLGGGPLGAPGLALGPGLPEDLVPGLCISVAHPAWAGSKLRSGWRAGRALWVMGSRAVAATWRGCEGSTEGPGEERRGDSGESMGRRRARAGLAAQSSSPGAGAWPPSSGLRVSTGLTGSLSPPGSAGSLGTAQPPHPPAPNPGPELLEQTLAACLLEWAPGGAEQSGGEAS